MGITGLLRFVKDATDEIHVKKYAGQIVAVDTYCWIHRGSFACAEKLAKNENTDQYVKYCMKFIDMLESFRVKPILVFDGCRLPSKELVEQERHKRRKENLEKGKRLLREGKLSAARDCFTKCISVTPAMALRVIEAARARGVDCVVAPYEADAQLAFFAKTNLAQAIVTEDSDLLCFGCKNVIFKMDLTGRAQEVSIDNLGRVKNLVGFTQDLFRHMCILSGCDYLPSVRGVGLVKACKALKLSKSKDGYRVAAKLHQYIKGLSPVDQNYGKEFDRADKTFLYQLVFNPLERKIQPLNKYPKNVDAKDLEFAGPLISDEKGFQIALGNIDINTQLVISYFDVDAWIINRKPADNFPSIWGDKPLAVNVSSKSTAVKPVVKNESTCGDKVDVISTTAVLDAISNETVQKKEKESDPSSLKNSAEAKTIYAGDLKELLMTYQDDKNAKKQKPATAKVVKSRFFASQTSSNLTKEFDDVVEEEVTNHSSSLFSNKSCKEDSILNDILDEINEQVEVGVKRSASTSDDIKPKRNRVFNSSSESLQQFSRRKKKRLNLPLIAQPSTNSNMNNVLIKDDSNLIRAKNETQQIDKQLNDESIPFLDKDCISQSLFGSPLCKTNEETPLSDHNLSDVENDFDEGIPMLDKGMNFFDSQLRSPRQPLGLVSTENCANLTSSAHTCIISSDEENDECKSVSPKCQSQRLGLPSRGCFKSPVKLNVSKYFSGSKPSGLRKSKKTLPNQPSIKSFFRLKT